MVDLSERENEVWGRERGDRENTKFKIWIVFVGFGETSVRF